MDLLVRKHLGCHTVNQAHQKHCAKIKHNHQKHCAKFKHKRKRRRRLRQFAVCSLLISYLWFAKMLKKPPDLSIMPSLLALLDGSSAGAAGSHEGVLDGDNAIDVMILSLPA